MSRQLSQTHFDDCVDAYAEQVWAFVPVVSANCPFLGIAVANCVVSPIATSYYSADSYADAEAEAKRLNDLMQIPESIASKIAASAGAAYGAFAGAFTSSRMAHA